MDKKNGMLIPALAVVVGAVLAIGAFWLSTWRPGFLTALGILILFGIGQWLIWTHWRRLAHEFSALESATGSAEPETVNCEPGTAVGRLIAHCRAMRNERRPVMLSHWSSVQSAREQGALVYALAVKHAVLVVGILGTAYGLIQSLIPGTENLHSAPMVFIAALLGIVAFAGLGASLSILRRTQFAFFASMEEFVHFRLAPRFSESEDGKWMELKRSAELLAALPDRLAAVGKELSEAAKATSVGLDKGLAVLAEGMRTHTAALEERISASIDTSLGRIEQEGRRASSEMVRTAGEGLVRTMEQGLEAPLRSLQALSDSMGTSLGLWLEEASKLGRAASRTHEELLRQGKEIAEEQLKISVEQARQEREQGHAATEALMQQTKAAMAELARDGRKDAEALLLKLDSQGQKLLESVVVEAKEERAAAAQARAEWLEKAQEAEKRHRESIEEALSVVRRISRETLEAQSLAMRDQSQGLLSELSQALESLVGGLQGGAGQIQSAVTDLVRQVEEKLVAGQVQALEGLLESHSAVVGQAGDALRAQAQAGLDSAERMAQLTQGLETAASSFGDASYLLQANQAEMQAGVAMLNSALTGLLDRLDRQAGSEDAEARFISQLNRSLAAFHEKSTEVLIDNALRTQEILLEAMSGGSAFAANGGNPREISKGVK